MNRQHFFLCLLVLLATEPYLSFSKEECEAYAEEGSGVSSFSATVSTSPPYEWKYKEPNNLSLAIFCSNDTGCESKMDGQGMTINATTSLSQTGSWENILYFYNVSRWPWNIEGLWKLIKGQSIYKECRLYVFARPETPQCQIKRDAADGQLVVTCHTDKVYPHANCRFFQSKNGGPFEPIEGQIVHKHTDISVEPLYHRTECSINVNWTDSESDQKVSFIVTMIPTVKGKAQNPNDGTNSSAVTMRFGSPPPLFCDNPILTDRDTAISVTCRSEEYFPDTVCDFNVTKGSTPPTTEPVTDGTVTYNHNETNNFKSECTLTLSIENFGSGEVRFDVSMVTDDPNVVSTTATGPLNLSLPTITITNCEAIPMPSPDNYRVQGSIYVTEGTNRLCECVVDQPGNPRGTSQWTRSLNGQVAGLDVSSTTVAVGVSDVDFLFTCSGRSALGTKDYYSFQVYKATGPSNVTIQLIGRNDTSLDMCQNHIGLLQIACSTPTHALAPDVRMTLDVAYTDPLKTQKYDISDERQTTQDEYIFSTVVSINPSDDENITLICTAKNSAFEQFMVTDEVVISLRVPPSFPPRLSVEDLDSNDTWDISRNVSMNITNGHSLTLKCSVSGGIPPVQAKDVKIVCEDRSASSSQVTVEQSGGRLELTNFSADYDGLVCFCQAAHESKCYKGISPLVTLQLMTNFSVDLPPSPVMTPVTPSNDLDSAVVLYAVLGSVAAVILLGIIIGLLVWRKRRSGSEDANIEPDYVTFDYDTHTTSNSTPRTDSNIVGKAYINPYIEFSSDPDAVYAKVCKRPANTVTSDQVAPSTDSTGIILVPADSVTPKPPTVDVAAPDTSASELPYTSFIGLNNFDSTEESQYDQYDSVAFGETNEPVPEPDVKMEDPIQSKSEPKPVVSDDASINHASPDKKFISTININFKK